MQVEGLRVIESGTSRLVSSVGALVDRPYVAVALALATDLGKVMEVTMVADSGATLTTHAVSASGTSGDYEFTIRNRPHPLNPATSGVVPAALLNDNERLAR